MNEEMSLFVKEVLFPLPMFALYQIDIRLYHLYCYHSNLSINFMKYIFRLSNNEFTSDVELLISMLKLTIH
jgi:hypothetical protein